MKNKFSGKFIVLDGPDGCGKTTQCKLIAEWLNKQGVQTELFRDPGGTPIGEKIRQILLNPENLKMQTTTEILLFMATRAQLWRERIKPALQEDKCVILDRWLSSTCAYQGYASGFGMNKIMKIAEDCLEKPWPDLTVILDVDIKTASERLNRDLDRMEQKGDGYHKKVRKGFSELAKDRDDFTVIDATDDIDSVHRKVIEAMSKLP